MCAADCKGVWTPPGIPPDISNSVETREAEDAELGAEVEAATLTNSKEETGTEDKGNDQDVILGHRNSPDAVSDNEGREETMKKDEEGKTGADQREMESDSRMPEFQDDVKVGDDQRFNQGSNKSNEGQEELGTDVRQRAGQENKTGNHMKSRIQRESQLKPSPKNNEDTVERTHDPKPSRFLDRIMNEEESQRDTKSTRTETSQDSMSVKSEDGEREPEPKATKLKILGMFDNLNLKESNAPATAVRKRFRPFSPKQHENHSKKKRTQYCFPVCGARANTSDSD